MLQCWILARGSQIRIEKKQQSKPLEKFSHNEVFSREKRGGLCSQSPNPRRVQIGHGEVPEVHHHRALEALEKGAESWWLSTSIAPNLGMAEGLLAVGSEGWGKGGGQLLASSRGKQAESRLGKLPGTLAAAKCPDETLLRVGKARATRGIVNRFIPRPDKEGSPAADLKLCLCMVSSEWSGIHFSLCQILRVSARVEHAKTVPEWWGVAKGTLRMGFQHYRTRNQIQF